MTDFIQSHLVLERLGAPLLHFLWQGALLAALTAVALRRLNRRSAELRYGVAIGALVLMAAAPVATFVFHQGIASFTRAILLTLAHSLPVTDGSAPILQQIDWNQWMAPINESIGLHRLSPNCPDESFWSRFILPPGS